MKMTARSVVFELDVELGGFLAVTSGRMERCAMDAFLFYLFSSNFYNKSKVVERRQKGKWAEGIQW